MPYITQAERDKIADGQFPDNPGGLNYMLTTIVQEYFKRNGGRYQQINDVLGALEGAKLEFVRVVVNPYEAKKQQENGDV